MRLKWISRYLMSLCGMRFSAPSGTDWQSEFHKYIYWYLVNKPIYLKGNSANVAPESVIMGLEECYSEAAPYWVQQCYRSAMLEQWTAFQYLSLHYPQYNGASGWYQWRQFIRLHFTCAAALTKIREHNLMCKFCGFTL